MPPNKPKDVSDVTGGAAVTSGFRAGRNRVSLQRKSVVASLGKQGRDLKVRRAGRYGKYRGGGWQSKGSANGMQLDGGAYYRSRKRISAGSKRGGGDRRKRTYRDVAGIRRRSRDGGKS